MGLSYPERTRYTSGMNEVNENTGIGPRTKLIIDGSKMTEQERSLISLEFNGYILKIDGPIPPRAIIREVMEESA